MRRNGDFLEGFLGKSFPGRAQLFDYNSFCKNEPVVINEFLWALRNTAERCYVLDLDLKLTNFLCFKEAFDKSMPEAIRIITGSQDSARILRDQLKMLRDRFCYRLRRNVNCGVGFIKKDKQIKIHDRFAILDDNLWHYGSNIGVSRGHLTAVSIWNGAGSSNAIASFEEIWDYLRSLQQAWTF